MTEIELGNELNEVEWWANWGHLTWFADSCYGLLSQDFKEPLFNRVGFIDSKVQLRTILPSIRRWYARKLLKPSFFLRDSRNYDSLYNEVTAEGYSMLDKHFVMSLDDPKFTRPGSVVCTFVDERRADEWSTAYLSAFYGEDLLFTPVLDSVRRALRRGKSKLLLAEFQGQIAGTLAIHTRAGYSGVYCVGTLPELRGRGVATGMLSEAFRLTQRLGTKFILQTFASDAVEGLYLKLGFRRAYSKRVLVL